MTDEEKARLAPGFFRMSKRKEGKEKKGHSSDFDMLGISKPRFQR
jgi:hypothetical protein